MPESSLQGTALEMVAGGALLLLASTAAGDWARFSPEHISTTSALAVAYLIIFGSLITYSAYTWLLKQTTPAVASTYAFVNPAIAVLLGWAFAGEEMTFLTLLAAAVIIAAVVLITTSRMRPK
jgi:drug/metabolite transporter (DMT)-like permease